MSTSPVNGDNAVGVFATALAKAFHKASLEALLRTKLNKKLANVSSAMVFPAICLEAAERAEEEGWLDPFIRAARAERPDKAEFQSECDRALALLALEQRPRPPARRAWTLNLVLLMVALGLPVSWCWMMFGVAAGRLRRWALRPWSRSFRLLVPNGRRAVVGLSIGG